MRHAKIPETYVLEMPGCLMETGINKLFQNIKIFAGVHHTGLQANLHLTCVTHFQTQIF